MKARRFLRMAALIAAGAGCTVGRADDPAPADAIIQLERTALDRWGRGDPEGYLSLYARDVTYFDPMRERRIDGLDTMRQLLEPIKGLVKVDRYEMIEPRVTSVGDFAVLTYNLVSQGRRPDGGAVVVRWNSSVVYRRIDGFWKILHSHWSYTKPELKIPATS